MDGECSRWRSYPSTGSEMRIVSHVNIKRPTLAIVGVKEAAGAMAQEGFLVLGYNDHQWKIASRGVFVSILTVWFPSSCDVLSYSIYLVQSPERLHMQHSVFPPSWAPQGDALE